MVKIVLACFVGGVLALAVILGGIYALDPAPHCAQYQTIRETVEPYTEYYWNALQWKMIKVEHPAQTLLSWQYCVEPK